MNDRADRTRKWLANLVLEPPMIVEPVWPLVEPLTAPVS